jgi:hypothetical protein
MLVNYVQEHDYRWLTGDKLHRSLWSPPIFYPQHDTAVYTDLMLGALPPYALWRMLGIDPLTAFQLWIVTVSALNFLSAYWLLRHVLSCGRVGSSAGAILLAFASPRLLQLGHPQLLPAFYIVIAFAGLCILLSPGSHRVYFGLALLLGGFCLQLYTAFYYAWFMAFTLSLGLLFALLLPSSRSQLLSFLQTSSRPALIGIVLTALALAPYAAVARNVLGQVGGRPYSEVQNYLPGALAWFAQGSRHLLYGGLNRFAGAGPDYGSRELLDGIGLFTTALLIGGFFLFRKEQVVRLWSLVALSVIILTYRWPGGHSLWRFVYNWFPGASAIRAVSRFGLFLLLPASIVLAFTLDRIGRYSRSAAIVCLLAVGLEQAGSLNGLTYYAKDQAQDNIDMVASQIRPDCKAFLFSWTRGLTAPEIMHVMGMWAGLKTGVPTVNGYSGQFPPHWPLADVAVANLADRRRVLANIDLWTDAHRADFENLCWILPDPVVPTKTWSLLLSRSADAGGNLRPTAPIDPAPPKFPPPFGAFAARSATPVLTGTLLLAGWALSSQGISAVDLWREPNPGEPTPPNGLIYIGPAIWGQDARPDVEKIYPNYPRSRTAGWSYLLHARDLPSLSAPSGAIRYRIHAIAHDQAGNSADLGVKTIIVPNRR